MGKSPLVICDQRFIDAQGRQVLLHGINLVNKDPKVGYLGNESADFFAQLRDWGFNCLRLGVIWDGLEPEPGKFDETYLQGIDRQVTLADQHGLYVFLDMHQDLYSVLFSDGAPAWATLTGEAPHIAGGIWSDAYFTSPAVQAALDHFWENAPAPDGVGLQDHYAQAWAVLAQRYASNPAVIGYDLMNEPFPGSLALEIQALMFSKGAQQVASMGGLDSSGLLSDLSGDPVESLAQLWLTPEGRNRILQLLEDVGVYAQVIDATQALYNAFERTKLFNFYQRVGQAIRSHDPEGFLLLETTMGSNMGVVSALQPFTGPVGVRDSSQVYAAHGYDLVTDTADLAKPNPARIELIFRRHAETARRLGMPLLVGEWGAYGETPGTLPAAWQVVEKFEQLLASETYWAYIPGIEKTDSFPAINRPYPERVAGVMLRYRYDPIAKRFDCSWREHDGMVQPSRFYFPAWFNFDNSNIRLSPWVKGYNLVPATHGSGNRWLEVPSGGSLIERWLTIQGN